MMKRSYSATAVVVLMIIASGCATNRGNPATGVELTQMPNRADFSMIAGQFPIPATTTRRGEKDAPVRACVNIAGTPARADLALVDCSSDLATYRVIQRVRTPSECIADADRPFYFSDGRDEWTACLDLNWDNARCISIDGVVSRVACDEPNLHNIIRPTELILNTATVDGCADGGYAHPIRRFTVCTQQR